MSQNENVTNVTSLPTPEAQETVTLTFNKKKIARIAGFSTAAVAAVTGAVLYFKKAQSDESPEPLEDEEWSVVETPAQD